MKKVLFTGLVVGVLAILVGAAAITIWGGVRALNRNHIKGVWAQAGRGEQQAELRVEGESYAWKVIEGTIVEGSSADSDIVVRTANGEKISVGLGPGWLATQGFTLKPGDKVTVRGFEEDGEFKAAEITRASDGQKITLRDETGRPSWAGAGRGAGRGQGQGRGRRG